VIVFAIYAQIRTGKHLRVNIFAMFSQILQIVAVAHSGAPCGGPALCGTAIRC